ncbi:unnamed protein product [Tuber aestivum]|uniref:Rhodopsin domain-containing protein n=1 Tax=Tuber aestivum TaxID=59557 RepID=A0A292Q2G0_9PEZI|nr:unnamed protein product [Tuber aestivum]
MPAWYHTLLVLEWCTRVRVLCSTLQVLCCTVLPVVKNSVEPYSTMRHSSICRFPRGSLQLPIGYVSCAICFIIIITRLGSAYRKFGTWALDDYWMVSALAVLIVRMTVIHLVIVNGTNNVHGLTSELSDEERRRREFGSKLVLIGRSCYAIFIWCMKFGIASFYARIVAQLEEYRVWLKYLIFGRQVSPDPGEACNFSEVQLFTTGACNIFTDLVLIIFPLPVILGTQLPLRRKLQIGGLFSLGFLVILVSVFRLPYVVENNAIQRWRSLFASIEILVACFVANAPALYRTIGVRTNASSAARSSGEGERGWYLFTVNKRKIGVRVLPTTGTTTRGEEREESEGAAEVNAEEHV